MSLFFLAKGSKNVLLIYQGHVFGFGTYVIDTPEPDCLGTFAEVFYTDEIFLPENPKYNDLAVYRNPTKKEYATLTLGPKVIYFE